jgi:hypothetical protein
VLVLLMIPFALGQPLPSPLEPATVAAPLEPNPGFTRDGATAVNPEQLESLQVLALALVPVALIWWAWLRLLR